MSDCTTFSMCVDAITAAAMIGGLGFAGLQLRAVAQSNRTANLVATLELEAQLDLARHRYSDKLTEINQLLADGPIDDATNTQLQLDHDEAEEAYLNVIDRICLCVRHGLIDEKIHRPTYSIWLFDEVTRRPELLEDSSRYPHIKAVYEAWNRGNSALVRRMR